MVKWGVIITIIICYSIFNFRYETNELLYHYYYYYYIHAWCIHALISWHLILSHCQKERKKDRVLCTLRISRLLFFSHLWHAYAYICILESNPVYHLFDHDHDHDLFTVHSSSSSASCLLVNETQLLINLVTSFSIKRVSFVHTMPWSCSTDHDTQLGGTELYLFSRTSSITTIWRKINVKEE